MDKQLNISVIGLGRFGSFWAREISKSANVFTYDINHEKLSSSSKFATPTSLNEALEKDYIILTIPIREIENFVRQNGDKIKSDSILIDSASVKTPVVDWFEKLLPSNVNYFFTHPLFGPDSGSAGLKGLSITLLPGKINYGKYLEFVKMLELLGLNILTLSPEEHDYLMAYNLNLIHLLGRSLALMNISSISLKMNALTYLNRMSHYVVNDSKILFEDFFAYNPYSGKIASDIKKNIDKIISELPSIKGE